MKPKKNDMVDKAEIIDDPSKRAENLTKITSELEKILDIQNNFSQLFKNIEADLKQNTSHDPEIQKGDTVDYILKSFEKIIAECKTFDELSSSTREKLYHITYNISALFFDYIHKMRKHFFSFQGSKYLNWVITQIENNVILSSVKYLKWRIKLYVELAFLYEDEGIPKSAFKVISQAITKVNELKNIEDQQGPLPDYINTLFLESFFYLKIFEFKYGALCGALTFDAWKKKLDDTFQNASSNIEEKLQKNICAVNTIGNLSWFNSIVNHDSTKISWKQSAVQYVYDTLLKTDINNIKTGILELIDRKKRDIELNKKIKQNEKDYEEALNEEISKNLQMNKNYKQSSQCVPIEIHAEILKACYDCSMWKEFIELLDSINLRIQYRGVEVPFLSEVDVQMSSIQYANIPNGYQRIQLDLNVNHYKREIRKLREAGKYTGGTAQEKKEETSNDKGKKPDPKGKKKPAANAVEDTETVNPYEKIDDLEHNFVYLLLRKSHNPKKALVGMRIVMSNDVKIKAELKENERAIALPIKTFKDNLYEDDKPVMSEHENKNDFTANLLNVANKRLPYLIIKKNKYGLEDDFEKMNALTDIFPLISNSPFAEPPMNYVKTEPELSLPGKAADVNYINYNFSHNYINICYKNDKMFYIIERESELLRNLYELEISYNDKLESVNEVDKFLKLYYPFEKIDILATWMYNAIQGEIGEFFLNQRSNFLYDICKLLWEKYLKDFLYRVEYYFNVKEEIEENKQKSIFDKIIQLQNVIFNTLFCVHYVMTNIKEKDVIVYSYLASRVADYAERTGNNSTGVIILKDTIDYIEKFKEDEKIFGMNNKENKHTFTAFTCDNNKIETLNKEINEKFDDYVKKLNLKRRVNYRQLALEKERNNGNMKVKVNKDEIAEENFEINYLEDEYSKKLQEKGVAIYDGKNAYLKDEKNKDSILINDFVTERENELNCIYVDLNVKMFRLYIKAGDAILKQYDFSEVTLPKKWQKKDSGLNATSSANSSFLSTNSKIRQHITTPSVNTLKKLDIIKGDTSKQVKANMEFLKHSLQDAGKLEPDKPNLSKSEKMMQFAISKNSYLNALFQASMAMMRPKQKQDQIFLLRLAAQFIDKCFTEEEKRMDYYRENFFYIKSLERYDTNRNLNEYSFYPYNLLYKPIMIDPVDKIPEPILINKTSRTATFMFPIVKIKNNQIDKVFHHITQVAMYGQISTGVNIVQLNNKALPKTGEIIPAINYLTIPRLKKNEKYIFAYAGYDNENVIINTIGKTSKEVELYFPLPLFYISYHVCKIAYEFKHYSICKERAKVVFSYFTERSEIKDVRLDNKSNTVQFYKLKYDFLSRMSLFELEGISYCFYYFAKSVAFLKPNDHDILSGTNIASKQKNVLKNINILSLGLEIAIDIRHYPLIKMFLVEIYNTVTPFLQNGKNWYKELLSVFMKMSLGCNIIPSDLWDVSLRKISSLISYTIFILSNRINESDLIRKSLVMELGIRKKHYYPFVYKFMQKIEEDPKAKKANPKDQKKPAKGAPAQAQQNPQTPEEQKPQLEEKTATVLKDLERECCEIDEFIFSCGDYNDIVKNKMGTYVTILDKYLKEYPEELYKDITVEIDNRKHDIMDLIEVYDGFKNEGVKYVQRFIPAFKDKERYYEFASKLLKLLIESFVSSISGINKTQFALTSFGGAADKKGSAKDTSSAGFAAFADIVKLVDDVTIKEEDIGFIQNIFNQKVQFLNGDILYKLKERISDFLNDVKVQMVNDKVKEDVDLNKMASQIEEKFFGCIVEQELLPPYSTLSENEVLGLKEKLYWISSLLFNKAMILYTDFINVLPSNHQQLLNYDFNNFFNFKLCDIKKINKYAASIANPDDDLKLIEVRSGLFVKKEKKKEEPENPPDEVVVNNAKDPKNKKQPPKKGNAKEEVVQDPIDPFDNHIERNFDARHGKLEKIFEKLSLSALCMNDVENFISFDNLMSLTYNIILYDMLTPYDACKNNIWCYLNIICEVALNRMFRLKKGINNYTEFNLKAELAKIKERISGKTFDSKPTQFPVMSKSSDTSSQRIDEEKLIAEYEAKINLDIYVQFICFVMQMNYYKNKWSILANVIQRFNEVTNELFAEFTLTYLIESQMHIYERAHQNQTDKQTEINHRNELYEIWKNSRKKNKRQQMITGEIPVEQQEYDRDIGILSKEYAVLSSLANLLRDDKEKSEKLYNSYLNDANNAMKAVNSCRKKYEEYQTEVMSMKKYAYNYGVHYKEYITKQKAIPAFANSIISEYKRCIQVLKKRQENYLLIQILYEMSTIMHSIGDYKNSEVYFNEALDTVFQKLYSIRDFRNLLSCGGAATEKYGIKSLCLAICILHKMCKFCYDNDLYNQRESALMAGEITFNILNNVIPTPMIMSCYGVYRLCDINMNTNIFKADNNIKPNDMLVALLDMSDVLIAYGDYEHSLPMLCLAEYIACDVCKSVNFTLRSRVKRICSLSELGLIHEAMEIYNKVIKKFDMPTYISYGYKDYQIGKYANSSKDLNYYNDLPPDDQKNVDAVNAFLKLSPDNDLKGLLGGNLYYELQLMRCSILFKIYNKENYAIYPEKNAYVDMRNETFIRIDKECRDNIVLISAYEDICYLTDLVKDVKYYQMDEKYTSVIKAKIEDLANKNHFTSDEINSFITAKHFRNSIDNSRERYNLIFRFRILLSKVFSCQGLSLGASGVLMRSIENYAKLSYAKTKIFNLENGEDYTFDFKQTEGKDAKGAGKAAKNAPPPKKDAKKGAQKEEENPVNTEEEMNKLLDEITSQYHGQRIIPNAVYWLKTQYLHLINCFKMGRYNDCLYLIGKFEKNSALINDVYFLIRAKEIETMVNIQLYEIDKAEKSFNFITSKGASCFINDYEICYFYGNYAEYLFIEKNYDLAISTLKTARTIIWEKMAKNNYLIQHQTIYTDKVLAGIEIDKSLTSLLKDREATYGGAVAGGAGGKKDVKGKGGAAITGNEIETINYFNTDNNNGEDNYTKPKVEYTSGVNLYNRYTDLICKIELKYVMFQLANGIINEKLFNSVLKDLELMVKKQLFGHVYYSILIKYIYGIMTKVSFVNSVRNFLKEQFISNFKMLKKNNIDVLTLDKEVLFKFSHYYNENVVSNWRPLLLKAKKYFEDALTESKTEFLLFENGFSVENIINALSDIEMLLAEYQIKNEFKYCDINQVVSKINRLAKNQIFYDKEDDDLPLLNENSVEETIKENKAEFFNNKLKAENIEHINYLKDYLYYSDLCIKVKNVHNSLFDNISELGAGANLVDPSRLPKDIFLQILECDYLTKKKNRAFVQNITVKNTVDTFDVLNLLKNYMKELEYFTFNFPSENNLDENMKNLTKVHRFLKANLANYATKCYIENTLATYDQNLENYSFIENDRVTVSYISSPNELLQHLSGLNSSLETKAKTFNLVYLLGVNSSKANAEDASEEDKQVFYGRIIVNEKFVQDLNQKIYNMKIKVRQSMTLSEEKKNRDFKYYQIDYDDMIYNVIKEFLVGKKAFVELKGVRDVFKNDDIGEVSIEALDFWYNLFNFATFTATNQKFNALLRKIHNNLLK